MKCKSWSNKINNFVVRRLKSIKINGQQQQQQTATQQQPQQQQQQYLSTCSTMPAMPKEKAATAVSLTESNFSELKLKDLATSAAFVAAAMATTTAAPPPPPPSMAANSRLQAPATSTQSVMAHQQQHAERNGLCGCGAVAAAPTTLASNEIAGSINRGTYYVNGHTSPLAAAAAASSNTSTSNNMHISSPQRATCCLSGNRFSQNGFASSNNANSNSPSNHSYHNNTDAATSPTYSSNSDGPNICSNNSNANNAAITPPKKTAKDFIFGKYIGEGSFSSVYLAVDVNTKREYAIKVCDKRHILREHKQEYVRREREVLHQMTNVPGFVNLSCTFQDHRSLYFVMTYAKNVDLLPYINRVGSFDVDCTRHYAAELVLACEQMHRRNIVHRDLKPENILLDEDMHTMIADFGSAKILTPEDRAAAAASFIAPASTPSQRESRSQLRRYADDDDDDDDDDDTGSDDVDSPSREYSSGYRRRRGSFVGTAQYVSPEVLQNGPITPAADLWALGCIVYQMISGLPPFRGGNDYVIFKEILSCNIDFPPGFDKEGESLVKQLLKIDPQDRLGAHDYNGTYDSIRQHPFFDGINFDTVRQQVPPPIYPYLPGVDKNEDFRAEYRDLEPGLDDKQLTRLLGMEFGTSLGCAQNGRTVDSGSSGSGSRSGSGSSSMEKKNANKNNFDLSDAEKQRRLEQQKSDKWHVFADNEVILKKGYVNKRKGLFARKRMLLLTTGARLIYIDPVQMVKKGEIPWSPELRVEPKNFKIFFVHTPNRTYYLEDPEGYSLQWVDAIEKMHLLTYNQQNRNETAATMTAPKAETASTSLPSASAIFMPTRRRNSPKGSSCSTGATTASNCVTPKTLKTASN